MAIESENIVQASDSALARKDGLQKALSALGWDLLSVEIDEGRGSARIDVKRNGRTVMLLVDHLGRASVERFRDRRVWVALGRRGDRFNSECLVSDFLGRERFASPREALRGFVGYLAHNGREGAEALEGAVVAFLGGGE